MDYSPKLKQAMAEIKGILSRYDIAGCVVIHDPSGHSEFLNYINPTYSCAKYEGEGVRLKAKLIDFPNKEAQLKCLTATSNMFIHLARGTGKAFLQMNELSDLIDNHLNAHHEDGKETSHQQQNN